MRTIATWGGLCALMVSSVMPLTGSGDTDDAAVSAAAVIQASEGLAGTVVEIPVDGRSDASVTAEGVVATLDADGGGDVSLHHRDRPGEVVGMGLAQAEFLNEGVVDAATGLATYEAPHDDFTYVPALRDDGTVQAHTVLDGPAAPTRFDYTVTLPAGGRMEFAGETVLILNSEGEMVGGIAPAWAKDAEGSEVSTRYEIHGSTLTQIVDHGPSTAYPVTADPWMGINLFGHVYKDTYNGQPRVNATLSPWGWAAYARSASFPDNGQMILNTYGLSEVLSRGQDIRDAFSGKASMNQQYSCHALGALAAGEWNLERFRPTLTVPWTTNLAHHRCNWKYSNGGV